MSLLLPSEWKEQLDVLNRIRTIHGSTALEGNPLSEAQIADFLGGRVGLDPEGREFRQIRNANIAQDWVRARFGPGRPPVSVGDILHMHALMTRRSDESDNVPGGLRTPWRTGRHGGTRPGPSGRSPRGSPPLDAGVRGVRELLPTPDRAPRGQSPACPLLPRDHPPVRGPERTGLEAGGGGHPLRRRIQRPRLLRAVELLLPQWRRVQATPTRRVGESSPSLSRPSWDSGWAASKLNSAGSTASSRQS